MELYTIRNIKTGEYLDYANKKRKLFNKNKFSYYLVETPFPTLRPKEHIEKYFKVWISNTPFPEDYVIIKFEECYAYD